MTIDLQTDCIVIGGGFGGLAAAIRLASQGHSVTLLEKDARLGGKAGVFVDGDFRSDTGPSVLTMLEEAMELLSFGIKDVESYVKFRQCSPAFRYLYEDGTTLDVHHALEDTRQSIHNVLGADALDEFDAFMRYSKNIWDGSAPLFVQAPAPSWTDLLGLALRQWTLIPKMDPLRSMKSGIQRFVRNPYLQDLLLRYATYNGSDPRKAPATLNCIAHVELALGGYGVVGGIEALVSALQTVAEELNVQIETSCPVNEIQPTDDGFIVHSSQGTLPARTVVVNADASHLRDTLLPTKMGNRLHIPQPYSMSGWTAVYEVPFDERTDRVGHTVVFPKDYTQEFVDIFDHQQPPSHPTIYVCAQHACHARPATANRTQAIFVMVNAPPEPLNTPTPKDIWEDLERRVRQRLEDKGLLPANAQLKWMRSPTDLATKYPGSRGSIYGSSSNNRFAAFTRPPNQITFVDGLFLASGSAHPGGGMPMAMISGKLAAQSCHKWLSSKQ